MEGGSLITAAELARLEPLSALDPQRLVELLALCQVERLPMGAAILREGERDNQTVYLLEGTVELTLGGAPQRTVRAGSPEALRPLEEAQPHRLGAAALSTVRVLRIDNTVLDYLLTWARLGAPPAAEPAPPASLSAPPAPDAPPPPAPAQGYAWVRRMRHIMALGKLPPAQLRPLLERMEALPVRAGEVVVRQGEPGEYYYVLTEGTAQVTRVVQLAELGPGACFGEEALISGAPRNASVTMTSDGVLMRLSRQDFDRFLREPLISRLDAAAARAAVSRGARWLDVRHAREFRARHLPGALNLPLHQLRTRMGELDRARPYVCCCQTGRRSAAAAFLLMQKGYTASVLGGGLQALPPEGLGG